MADSIAAPGVQPETRPQFQLACRLRQKETAGVRGPRACMGELELENPTQEIIEISYQMSPLQYLELTVIGPAGTVVSEGHFGDRFSPMREERMLRLQPGEKFIGEVPLLGTVPREKRSPGTYQVQASYEYNGGRAVSNVVEVIVP